MKRVMTILAIAAAVSPLGILAQTGNNSLADDNEVVQGQNVGQNEQGRITGGAAAGQFPRLAGGRGLGGGGSHLAFGGNQGYTYRLQSFSRYPGSAEKPLIIRSADMSPKDETNLEEDLAVMAHILDKALDELPGGQTHARSAMGIDVFVSPNSGVMRTMYLEGYGALFLVNVGFPLVAPASTAKEEKASGDSAWEEARQEVYGQSLEPQTLAPQGEEFSEEKVNRLKEALLKALKNATNIRGLEGDITICALGGANSVPVSVTSMSPNGAQNRIAEVLVNDGQAAPTHGTVLTIKVTKADADAFAKGELKFSDFRERARIGAYATAASTSGAPAVGYGGGRVWGN